MSRSLLRWVMALLFVRLLIMALFPVLGDEAYYVYWAQHPAGGYYDLPPMVGWWLIPFVKISLNSFFLRIPNLLAMGLTGFGLYEWLLKEEDRKKAMFAALAFVFLPLPFFALINFPDVPLLYTGFFAAYFFYRGVRDGAKRLTAPDLLISGALFGAAFLSKYFAVFLLPAFVVWFLLEKKKKWSVLAWFVLGALPFLFQHVYWNREHCWANFVFNLITRQKAYDGAIYETVGLFVLYLAFVGGPLLVRERFEKLLTGSSTERFLFLLWSIPVSVFLFTACLGRGQGLHWLLFLTPFFVGWVFIRAAEKDLARNLRRVMMTSSVLSVILLLGLVFPNPVISKFFEHRFKFESRFALHSEDFISAIKTDISGSAAIFTEGYSFSGDLNFAIRKYAPELTAPVGVWGSGSRFGRAFDWNTDWKSFDGKTISIVTPGNFWFWKWTQYFTKLATKEIKVGDVSIYVARGEGFRATPYIADEVKKSINEFYPNFAPGRCELKE